MALFQADAFAGRGAGAGAGGARGGAGGGGGGGAGPRRAGNPMRPMTIRQILDATRVGDGALIIDGREIGQVAVVGKVMSVEKPSATAASSGTGQFFTYKISDGSGVLTVKHWIDPAAAAAEHLPEGIPPPAPAPETMGLVVRCTGNVKFWQEQPQLSGAVREVKDHNEMTLHFLDAIHTHLRLTQGEREGPGGLAATPNKVVATPPGGAGPTAPAAKAMMPMTGGAAVDLESLISRIMMRSDRSRGVSPAELHTQLLAQGCAVSLGQVQGEVKRLVEAAVYYTTSGDRITF